MVPAQLIESGLFSIHVRGKDVARPFPVANPFGALMPSSNDDEEEEEEKEPAAVRHVMLPRGAADADGPFTGPCTGCGPAGVADLEPHLPCSCCR